MKISLLLAALALIAESSHAATVYRWVDADGVIHITSEKPPAGVPAERLELPTAKPGASSSRSKSSPAATTVSPARAAERAEVLDSLKNRECVVALEALDRKTSAAEPTSAAEIKRLQQTVDANCSSEPARRLEQEEQAARLRVANGPTCSEARAKLSQMHEQSGGAGQGDVRAQQQFVDQYCTPPVR
jgi:Domain of unknown function (DUF4124)